MKLLIASSLIAGATAQWPTHPWHNPKVPPIYSDNICFTPASGMYFEGDCKTAGTISMNDGGAHATCLHIKGGEKDGVKTSGMLYANLGQKVAAMPGCCGAAIDLLNVGMIAYDNPGDPHALNAGCPSKSCIASGATGNIAHIEASFSVAYRTHKGGTATGNINATNWIGKLPDAAAWAESENILWQDNAACLNAVLEAYTLPGFKGAAAGMSGVLGMGLSIAYGGNITASGIRDSTKAGCATNPSSPVSQIAHCTNSAANPIVSGSIAPRCFTAGTGSHGGLARTNCSATDVAQTYGSTVPECMWRSTTSSILGSSSMIYGQKAAAIPGCCTALQDLGVIALNDAGFTFTQSTCMSHNGCMTDAVQPSIYWKVNTAGLSTNMTGDARVGKFPGHTAYTLATARALENNAQCFKAAQSHYVANATQGSNQGLGSAYTAYIGKLQGLDVTANTTRACVVDNTNWGNQKPSCCALLQTFQGQTVADAYSTATTALCADTECATSAMTQLKTFTGMNWSSGHAAALLLFGNNTSNSASIPDVCQTTTPNYLTTTTTTVPPTTTPPTTAYVPTTTGATTDYVSTAAAGTTQAGQTSGPTTTTTPAPVVTVTSSYTATETLPANVTSTDLLTNTAYVSAKQAGLATTLSVASNKVTITGFTVSGRRQLSEAHRELTTATKTVETSFQVEVADSSTATTVSTTLTSTAFKTNIKSNTNLASVTVGGYTPAIGTVSAVSTPSTATVAVLTSGTFSVEWYSDSACSTAHSTRTTSSGAIAATTTCVADQTSASMEINTCGADALGNSYATTNCSGTASTLSMKTGICTYSSSATAYFKVTCNAPAGAAGTTSSATTFGISTLAAATAGVLIM